MKTQRFLRAFTPENKLVWVAIEHISSIQADERYSLYKTRVVMTNKTAYYCAADPRQTIKDIESGEAKEL